MRVGAVDHAVAEATRCRIVETAERLFRQFGYLKTTVGDIAAELGMSSANDWTKDLLKLGLPEIKTIYQLFDEVDRVTAMYMPFEHGDHLPQGIVFIGDFPAFD